PALIPQRDQAQTFSREVRGLPEFINLLARYKGLIICCIELREYTPLGLAQRDLGLLLLKVGLAQLTSQRSPIPKRNGQGSRNEIAQGRRSASLRDGCVYAMSRNAIRFQAPNRVKGYRRQKRALRSFDVQIRLPESFRRHADVRIHPPGHLLRLPECRQGPRRTQVIYRGEIFVESWKDEYTKVQPRIFHSQVSFRERGLLLLILNLRL